MWDQEQRTGRVVHSPEGAHLIGPLERQARSHESPAANAHRCTLSELELDRISPFSCLSRDVVASIRSHLRVVEFPQGATIVREGECNPGKMFIIMDGEASVCKEGRHPINQSPVKYEIARRGKNALIGSISLLDNRPASASVYACTHVKAALLDLEALPNGRLSRKVRNALASELARHLAARLRRSIDRRVDILRQEAELAGYRNAIGMVIVTALSVLSFYTLTLSLVPSIKAALGTNVALSPLIIIVAAAIFGTVIRLSRFPPAFYGLRLDNWRPAMTFALKASAAFLLAAILIKWLLIHMVDGLNGLRLISPAAIAFEGQVMHSWPLYLVSVAVYVLLVPLQEFVARSGIQAPLYAFLGGSELKRHAWSILVSNFAFAAVHAHTNLAFAIATFIPGVLWGWIFARTNSLLAVSISHVLIGGAGIFVFGAEEFLTKLFH